MADLSAQIVDEMVARLRVLQGSGEFPPLTRKVEAGEGLQGGGTLEKDMTLSLDDVAQARLQALADLGELSELATTAGVTELLGDYVRVEDAVRNAVYRDFTVSDAPAVTASSPPLRMDVEGMIERVTVSVASPTSEAVRVTVRGANVTEVVTVPGGTESQSWPLSVAVDVGATVSVEVAATSAAGIVVSLRVVEG